MSLRVSTVLIDISGFFLGRLLVLQLVREFCQEGNVVIDLGASPFIMSCALKCMDYRVIAIDYNPSEYLALASQCEVEMVKADLEMDKLSLLDAYTDCVVLSEVLEHLDPYYISYTMSEINRILKLGRILVLTTPNIASLFRRLRLLLGIQPQFVTHVREYTIQEMEELLMKQLQST
ncbi:MAG: class I SAM-dependent methyltransferase [Desulfurococcaceae archaeon]